MQRFILVMLLVLQIEAAISVLYITHLYGLLDSVEYQIVQLAKSSDLKHSKLILELQNSHQ